MRGSFDAKGRAGKVVQANLFIDCSTGIPYMLSDDFEWDDAKAEQNWAKHGVAFAWATKAFRDACAVEWIDARERYDEERINMLAGVEGIIVHVTYVEVDGRVRIISARRATRHEKDRYFRENAED